jgi:hypothetical protein
MTIILESDQKVTLRELYFVDNAGVREVKKNSYTPHRKCHVRRRRHDLERFHLLNSKAYFDRSTTRLLF